MSSKVLITGASGFVGYHLVVAAQNAGLQVYAAVRNSSRVEHLEPLGISFLHLDYDRPEALQQQLEAHGFDYIIHAAGVTKASGPEAYNKVNAAYTRNIGLAAAAAGVKKMVFLSSLAALGPQADTQSDPITEQKKAGPVTDYGRSKLLAEQYLAEIEGLPLVVLRPTAVYGPRDRDIFIMMRTIHKGLEPYIGRRPQTFSFIHATDLAEISVKALFGTATGTYNLSDGGLYGRYEFSDITKTELGRRTFKFHVPLPVVRVIAGLLEKTAGKNTPALNREKLAELTASWPCSIEKARRELGFAPKYNLENGLRQTIGWYRDHKWL